MKKRQNGLMLICAKTDEELSSLALSVFSSALEPASSIVIISKQDRFTEQDLDEVKTKHGACIYHFFLDSLDIKDSPRLVFEALRLSPRIIYFDNFDFGPMIDSVVNVAESSHLIILGVTDDSPSNDIKELGSKIRNRYCLDCTLKAVIAPSYKEDSQNHSV